jgi:hypothetical protein
VAAAHADLGAGLRRYLPVNRRLSYTIGDGRVTSTQEGAEVPTVCGRTTSEGTVKLILVMIYFAKENTKCGGYARRMVAHLAFVLAKWIMIKVNLTVPDDGRSDRRAARS